MLRKMGNKLERIEEDIFEGAADEVVRDISNVKQEIINFRKVVRPQRAAFRDLERTKTRYIPDDLDIYFDDIVDASERIWDMLENYKEVIEGLEDTNESAIAHRSNETFRILTAASVIILPLTLIASIFGMNVRVPGESSLTAFWISSWSWSRCWPGCSGTSATASGSRPRMRPRRRMLVVVNPFATTMSDRLKHLVVYALQARYDVTAVETTGRGHAAELARDAAPTASTSSSPSAATGRSTRPPTASRRPRRRSPCSRAARRTSTAGCSARPSTSWTRRSACSTPRRTGASAGSTSAGSASAGSCSPPAWGSTRRSSSASTATRG